MGRIEVGVTGLGAYTPLGIDVASTWTAALEGRSGIGDASFMPPDVPFISPWSQVKYFGRVDDDFGTKELLASYDMPKEYRDLGRASMLAIRVGVEALTNARILVDGKIPEELSYGTGCMVGTGGGDSFNVLEAEAQRMKLNSVKPSTTKKIRSGKTTRCRCQDLSLKRSKCNHCSCLCFLW